MTDSGRKETIMIIDDTPANLGVLEEMLYGNGYEVAAFSRGKNALQAAADNPPDLVLLDILMPETDGFAVCDQFKSDIMLEEIPIIFISALDDTANKVKAFAHGGVDYISKPFQTEEVLARVKTHLHLRQQQKKIVEQHRKIADSFNQLAELEHQRDQLVHMVVHDMRSPLMGVLGNAELLEMDIKSLDRADMLETIGDILEAGNRLQSMITNLLDISRMEAGEMPLHLENSDVREILTAAITGLGGLVDRNRVSCEQHFEAVMGRCDKDLVRRVVENLLGNAIKFSGPEGKIEVAAHTEDNKVKICVADNGTPVPKELHEKIFKKFGQAQLKKEVGKFSSGLGLAFCKLAVEAHGGEIGIESGGLSGNTFWFTIPAAE